jgi:prepilin-type N-terminal cleavage/methylation domain-containing protein
MCLISPASPFKGGLYRPCRSDKSPVCLRRNRAGFTLIELAVVILIIGLISAVALPQLMPLLIFSELDGTARKLAYYGSAAVAEAALFGTDLTVYADLDNQEIYTIQITYPKESEEEEDAVNQLGMFSDFRRSGKYSAEQVSEMLAGKTQGNRRQSGDLPEGFDPGKADAQMADQFNVRHRQMIYTRAKNVKQEASFLSEIGPLFDEGFQLSWAEPIEEELSDPILGRIKLPTGVRLESININNEPITRGVAEIKVSNLGLEDPVVLYLRNEDDEYFTVIWNPLTGRGVAQEGRQ